MTRLAYSLMYHDVIPAGEYDASGIRGADADVYKLEHAEFRRHLEALSGLRLPGAGETVTAGGSAEIPLYITFDDGGASSLWVADRLDEHGWKGHFFVVTDWIGQPGFLHAPEIRDLAERGHVIGSHSRSHPPRLSALPLAAIAAQWTDSIARLSAILGRTVNVASVPGGFYSRQVRIAAEQAGITHLFTSEPTDVLRQVGNLWLIGRYYIQRGMSIEQLLSFAGGADSGPRRRQALLWGVKKIAKAAGGELYVKLRKRIIR